MTAGQDRAYENLWPIYGIEIKEDVGILKQETLYPQISSEWILEIGFGNGESLVQMAINYPEKNFLGIEVHGPGVGHALLKIEEANIQNLRLIRHDAVAVLNQHVEDNSFSRIQIYFPDPWPKKRHHKRRLVQKSFTDFLYQKLTANGELHCATDWENYAQWMQEIFIDDQKWENLGNEDGFAERPDWRPLTKFEKRGLNKGHGVWDLRYQASK
nr:tRNA (guanosine(46)-N7)-methyltransferase TrmB [Suttonella ornithocola]